MWTMTATVSVELTLTGLAYLGVRDMLDHDEFGAPSPNEEGDDHPDNSHNGLEYVPEDVKHDSVPFYWTGVSL